jgi:hypothetical protein
MASRNGRSPRLVYGQSACQSIRAVAGFVHDVAPVASHGGQVQQDGFVFGLGQGKGACFPVVPVDDLGFF